MKSLMKSAFTMTLLAGIFALGCSSSGNGDDGGADAGQDTGPTPFALSAGATCFDVVSIQSGVDDGCDLGVAGVVGTALPVNYDPNTAILTVGTDGAEGGGQIAFNVGTLLRDSTANDPQMPTCTWHQTDTSNVTVTAANEFDIMITEVENMFATACGTAGTPTGGTCTSAWTWHMKKGTKTPPGCK
jgi:hypothetical protein